MLGWGLHAVNLKILKDLQLPDVYLEDLFI